MLGLVFNLSQFIFLLIVNVLLLKFDTLYGFLVVLMHIKVAELGYLNYTARDIGAMVGYTLEVCEKVGKNEAVLDSTLALLQSYYVIELYLVAKVVNDLLDGLNLFGKADVVFQEGLESYAENFLKS